MFKFNTFVYDLIAAFDPDIINGNCCANFILPPRYKDEGAPFGFDWVRKGNYTGYVGYDVPYKGHMGRNFSDVNGDVLATDVNLTDIYFKEEPDIYSKLCRSYPPANLKIFPSVNGRLQSYNVPVLSIFPYTGNSDDIAHLLLEINITTSPREIYLEYDETFLEIQGAEDIDTEYGVQTIEISVKCIQELPEDQYVRVFSVSQNGKKANSGLMRVCKNSKKTRAELQIMLINIKFLSSPEDDAIVYCGDTDLAQKSLTKFLHHALITPNITVEEVDLGYKGGLESRLTEYMGSPVLIKDVQKSDGQVDPNYIRLHELLLGNIMHIPDLFRYNVTIFCVGTDLCSILYDGSTKFYSGYQINKVIMLAKDILLATPAHEMLHALGLSHTFNNMHLSGLLTDYTYEIYATDNIMDYTHHHDIARVNLWEWQWKKARIDLEPDEEFDRSFPW